MKKILIALPIYKRVWILDYWFRAIENQTYPLENIGFIFAVAEDDEETIDALYEWHSRHPEVPVFDLLPPEPQLKGKHRHHEEGMRYWNSESYLKMVTLRNNLLERATDIDFDYYLSLDSDILLFDPNSIQYLVDNIEKYKVLSPLTHMRPDDDQAPNVMWWVNHPGYQAYRRDIQREVEIGDIFEADIIMAAVMMTRDVYQKVRYRWHKQGEDLGFATELARNGFKSFCAPSIYAFHCMHQFQLAPFLEGDIDPRNPNLYRNTV